MPSEDTLFTLTPMTDSDIMRLSKGKEVLNNRDYNLKTLDRHAVPGGLFDPTIFGKYKRCVCGTTVLQKGQETKACPYCKTIVFSTQEELRNNFAFYRLKVPVIFPYKVTKFWSVLSELGLKPIKPIDGSVSTGQWEGKLVLMWNTEYNLIEVSTKEAAQLVKDNLFYKLDIKEVSTYTPYNNIGLIGLYNLQAYRLIDGRALDFSEYLNMLIPITSTYFRRSLITNYTGEPLVQLDNKSIWYSAIIEYNKVMSTYLASYVDSSIDTATIMCNLNLLIDKTMQSTEFLEGGKYHTLRDNIRQTVRRSARANIIPALDLDMNHVRIPRSLAYKALDGDVMHNLQVNEGMDSMEAERAYNNQTSEALKEFKDLVDASMVVLLRNPTLHKYNLVALHPLLTEDPAIGIPIDICGMMNADFDGDQTAFYFVTEPALVAQLQNDLMPEKVWFYEKEAKPIFTPTHEVLYGLHLATTFGKTSNYEFETLTQVEQAIKNGKIDFDTVIFLNDKRTTFGRAKIESILNGLDIGAVLGESTPIDKDNIAKIVSRMSSFKDRAKMMSELTQFAVEVVTHNGLQTPPFDKLYDYDDPEVKKILGSKDPLQVKYTKLNGHIEDSIKKKIQELPDSSLESMIKGSGRVKWAQLYDIYAPPIYGDGTIDVANTNLFQGLSERDFVNRGISNRISQQVKRSTTPIGGFASRQMVLSLMELIFKDERKSPDTVGLLIPKNEATGRTLMDGSIVEESNSDELVRVKSCVNHKQNFVYADEIDQEHLKEKDGAAIGISFAMSFTEPKTQAQLALKHVTATKAFEQEYMKAWRDGTIESLDSDFLMIKTSNGQLDKYLLSGDISFSRDMTPGSKVYKGEVLLNSKRVSQLHDQLADFEELVGMQSADKKIVRGRGVDGGRRGTVIKYAPVAGVISYPSKNTIKIGNVLLPTSKNEIYYYPEGYTVKVGDSICSGLLDLGGFMNVNGKVQDSIDAFKKQLRELYPQKTRSELVEVVFKSLMEFEFKSKKKYISTDNFINRQFYGDTKRGLDKFFKDSTDNVIEIKDSVILPIVLGLNNERQG